MEGWGAEQTEIWRTSKSICRRGNCREGSIIVCTLLYVKDEICCRRSNLFNLILLVGAYQAGISTKILKQPLFLFSSSHLHPPPHTHTYLPLLLLFAVYNEDDSSPPTQCVRDKQNCDGVHLRRIHIHPTHYTLQISFLYLVPRVLLRAMAEQQF